MQHDFDWSAGCSEVGGICPPNLDGVSNGRRFNFMSDASTLTFQVLSVSAALMGFGYWVTRMLASGGQMVMQRVPVRVERRRR